MAWALYVSVAVLTLTVAVVLWLAFTWHNDKGTDFDIRQCVVDSVTGKISIEKLAFMSALVVSTWGFVTLVLTEKMTEVYFTTYMGAFAVARAFSQFTSVKKDGQNASNS